MRTSRGCASGSEPGACAGAAVSEEQPTPSADLLRFSLKSLLSELLRRTQMSVFEGEIRWKNKDIIGSFLI